MSKYIRAIHFHKVSTEFPLWTSLARGTNTKAQQGKQDRHNRSLPATATQIWFIGLPPCMDNKECVSVLELSDLAEDVEGCWCRCSKLFTVGLSESLSRFLLALETRECRLVTGHCTSRLHVHVTVLLHTGNVNGNLMHALAVSSSGAVWNEYLRLYMVGTNR
jgi:hypothetical protein